MITRIKKNIPFNVKLLLKKIIFLGFKYYCNCCGSHIRSFCPGGEDLQPILENKIIGAGYREQDYCPVCKSTYRHRIVWAYLSNLKIWENPLSVLHVAPEEMIARKLSRIRHIKYIAGDTNPDRYRHYTNVVRLDITRMPFTDSAFDVIICNHVLEHITDDKRAMSELYRILKPEGFAMLQVPLSGITGETYENPAIRTEEKRLKHFGQKDHVRIYGKKDYLRRLAGSGFRVTEYNLFRESRYNMLEKLALDPAERIMVARKKSVN